LLSTPEIGASYQYHFFSAGAITRRCSQRRIKTQTVLPSAGTAAMLLWALLASGQINIRKVDGWQTLTTRLTDPPIDLAA
jgi:hypothetical protein